MSISTSPHPWSPVTHSQHTSPHSQEGDKAAMLTPRMEVAFGEVRIRVGDFFIFLIFIFIFFIFRICGISKCAVDALELPCDREATRSISRYSIDAHAILCEAHSAI